MSYLDLLTTICEQECLYSIYILVINMNVDVFEMVTQSNYFRFNLVVLKVFTIFYYYPKQSLLNMREEQDEAEYNEKTSAGQDSKIAEQFLHKLIERDYKDEVKGVSQNIKEYIVEGIINFYLK